MKLIETLNVNRLPDDYKKQDFADAAYDVILMCEANMGEYDDAMNGYEFLTLYHPDPDIRLAASWNYEEIDALINSGNGGGKKDLGIGISDLGFEKQKQLKIRNYELGIEEQEQLKEIKEIKRIDKIISDDPVMRKMKKSFEKANVDRKNKMEKQLREITKSDTRKAEYLKRSEELDNLKFDKAKRNILESKNLSKEELDKRRMQDLVLSTRDIRNEISNDEPVNIPSEYKLNQNYPNPFNPTTTISYKIPVDGLVKLKIFDILGKEVKLLVNEFKPAGGYKILFDGTELSSGIYFYRIEAGEFSQTMKLLLLK